VHAEVPMAGPLMDQPATASVRFPRGMDVCAGRWRGPGAWSSSREKISKHSRIRKESCGHLRGVTIGRIRIVNSARQSALSRTGIDFGSSAWDQRRRLVR
jgi:hypothetical protein